MEREKVLPKVHEVWYDNIMVNPNQVRTVNREIKLTRFRFDGFIITGAGLK